MGGGLSVLGAGTRIGSDRSACDHDPAADHSKDVSCRPKAQGGTRGRGEEEDGVI